MYFYKVTIHFMNIISMNSEFIPEFLNTSFPIVNSKVRQNKDIVFKLYDIMAIGGGKQLFWQVDLIL